MDGEEDEESRDFIFILFIYLLGTQAGHELTR